GREDFHRRDAIDGWTREADSDLAAAAGGHRNWCGSAWEVADAESVIEIRPAAPRHVTNFNEVLPHFLERVRQPRIGLTAGSVVTMSAGQLAAGLGVQERDLWVEGAAESMPE